MNSNRFSHRTNQSIVIRVANRKVFELPAGAHLEIIVRPAVRMSKKAFWKILDTPTIELPLLVRPGNALAERQKLIERTDESLRRAQPGHYKKPNKWVGQLVQLSESDLLKTKNFGRKSLKELKDVLASLGVPLGTPVGDWVPPDER